MRSVDRPRSFVRRFFRFNANSDFSIDRNDRSLFEQRKKREIRIKIIFFANFRFSMNFQILRFDDRLNPEEFLRSIEIFHQRLIELNEVRQFFCEKKNFELKENNSFLDQFFRENFRFVVQR